MKLMNIRNWKAALMVAVLGLAVVGLTTACRSHQDSVETRIGKDASENVPYTVLNHYFLKNNVNEISYPLISDQKEFEGLFGMATVMGADGQPTPVDFSTESVIAIILPETNFSTEIIPVRLEKGNAGLKMYYMVKTGEKMTSTMRPILLVKISKSNSDEVIPVEVKQSAGKK